MLCQYWGSKLPCRWLWLSANDFDRPGRAVEASVLTSQVWGRQVHLPTLGYAWLEDRSAHRGLPALDSVQAFIANGSQIDIG